MAWLRHWAILCQQEPTAEEFEDKDWTFVIENVSALSLLSLVVILIDT